MNKSQQKKLPKKSKNKQLQKQQYQNSQLRLSYAWLGQGSDKKNAGEMA